MTSVAPVVAHVVAHVVANALARDEPGVTNVVGVASGVGVGNGKSVGNLGNGVGLSLSLSLSLKISECEESQRGGLCLYRGQGIRPWPPPCRQCLVQLRGSSPPWCTEACRDATGLDNADVRLER